MVKKHVIVLLAALGAMLGARAANGQNLIANPGFEAGATGFASDYTYSAGGNCCEGEYTVRNVGNTFNASFVNPPAASPGSVQMMVINGSTVPNLRIWYQTLTVTPGTRYRLALRGCTAVAGGPAVLQWQINGLLIGSSVTLPSVTRQWVDVGAIWTAPAEVSTIALAVRDLNTATFPNDFYLDDLSMTPDCVADFDDGSGTGTRDGGVGVEDLLYYLSVYDLGLARADVDDGSGTGTTDGGVGIEDLLYYLSRFDAGC